MARKPSRREQRQLDGDAANVGIAGASFAFPHIGIPIAAAKLLIDAARDNDPQKSRLGNPRQSGFGRR